MWPVVFMMLLKKKKDDLFNQYYLERFGPEKNLTDDETRLD